MNDRVRVELATLWISSSRTTGSDVSDEDNAVRAGLRGMNHYWEIQLSEPMPCSSFIDLLARHFFEPTLNDGGQIYKMDLYGSIDFAGYEVPLIDIPGKKEPLVRSRQLVEWLLSKPKRAHLVPESLKAFVEGAKTQTAVAEPQPANNRSPAGRPVGTGYQKMDEENVAKMRILCETGKAKSLSDAARKVIGQDGRGAEGHGTLESKVERLARRATAKRRE